MATDRRAFFKTVAAVSVAAIPAASSNAAARRAAPEDAVGLLYDATKCIGCRTCTVACRQANDLSADTSYYGGGLYDAPDGLNQYSKTVIQLAKNGDEYSYVKKQCMHCVDPACVNACMLQALHKGKYGIVSWDANRCVGCRYCEVACPFNVPKFQWASNNPKIVKCELCRDRLAEGKIPASAEECPRKAVIYGKRDELLKEAHKRIDENPGAYVPKVYGETDLGGTQMLYLSHVPFEQVGFRFSQEESVPSKQRTTQHWIYGGFVAPIALMLGAITFRNRGKINDPGDEQQEE